MKLEIGMHVKLKNDIENLKDFSGTTKQVTGYLREYANKPAYELDNEKDAIYQACDFEYCIEYPNMEIE